MHPPKSLIDRVLVEGTNYIEDFPVIDKCHFKIPKQGEGSSQAPKGGQMTITRGK